jgi:hypothetical protein
MEFVEIGKQYQLNEFKLYFDVKPLADWAN